MNWQLSSWVVVSMFLGAAGPSRLAADEPAAVAPPRFAGLGSHTREVITKSPEAQQWFNQGLVFLFAFNHDEAIRAFEQAARVDPDCAMAWWGISIANGPHINNPVVPPPRAKAAWDALAKARATAANATEVERQLIEALGQRYAQVQPDDRKPLDQAYADAMRKVWKANPTDADIGALFAESLMDLRPWDLWLPTSEPQPGTDEVVSTLEAVLTQNPNHPLGLHLYIHAVEASPHPEKAAAPADRLRNLQPGLGHLVHMPSHIDVRLGRWAMAIEANTKAIESDRQYRQQSPKQDFYRIYMAHNHHMRAYAAMMSGQSKLAIASIHDMAAGIPPEWIKENALIADGFAAMPLEVLVRFGRWEEVLASPEPPEYLPISRSLRHAARGIAYSAQGNAAKARQEQTAFLAARKLVKEEAVVGNNKGFAVLDVAEHLLAGEILVREGAIDMGLARLRGAVRCEDALRYSEPPDWIHPIRHALGANLLTVGRPADAEKVYRASLARLPNDGWALFGLAKSLHDQGKHAEAEPLDARFAEAWRDADIKITSSCFCQSGR
ncbi:MAG: tetratricopeptide repeat protein [Planctomycetaceae bacterium]|nr:tetratricopeptide repeat protein [Planctomycetaceae bacterium]